MIQDFIIITIKFNICFICYLSRIVYHEWIIPVKIKIYFKEILFLFRLLGSNIQKKNTAMKAHASNVYCNNMECVTQLSFRTGIFRAIKFCVTFHLVLKV